MTHSIIGDVTAGETTVCDPVSVTVTDIEPESVVDEYDANSDGDVRLLDESRQDKPSQVVSCQSLNSDRLEPHSPHDHLCILDMWKRDHMISHIFYILLSHTDSLFLTMTHESGF